MKLSEKLQYKIRNLMYAQQRKKNQKDQHGTQVQHEKVPKEGQMSKFMQTIDEMDTYLGEKIKDIKISKRDR